MTKKPPSSTNTKPYSLKEATELYLKEAQLICNGGGEKGINRQHKLGRLTARERIDQLIDGDSRALECGLLAAWNMYKEYGYAPAAGVITTIGHVGGKLCMIVANDATDYY